MAGVLETKRCGQHLDRVVPRALGLVLALQRSQVRGEAGRQDAYARRQYAYASDRFERRVCASTPG